MPFNIKTDPARGDTLNFDTKVYHNIIEPAVKMAQDEGGLQITVTRADKVLRAGSIHERMIQFIADADVAIVDLTAANPNVFYELGVRHALRDRVTVLIRRRGTKSPFNIAGLADGRLRREEAAPGAADDRRVYPERVALRRQGQSGLRHAARTARRSTTGSTIASDVEEYEIPGLRGKQLGIVMGDLRHVNLTATLRTKPIEVWVNSENLNMSMSRPYEGSISATIRYLGARRDETGAIIDDVIANELRRRCGGGRSSIPARSSSPMPAG